MPPPQSLPPPNQKYPVPAQVMVGAALLVALAIICGPGAVGALPSLHGLERPTTTNSQPTAMPTNSNVSATLGGTLGAIAQRYGTSIGASAMVYAATLVGQRVVIVVTLDDASQSRDGQEHVIAIDVRAPSDAFGVEKWNAATAVMIASVFLPIDAHFQRSVILYGETYFDYHSDAIAATFLPSQYNSVPGSLNYNCRPWPPSASASGYGLCSIDIGSA